MSGVRCFLALDLTRQMRDVATRAHEAVIAVDRAWAGEKWVAPQNLHTTIAFFGDVAKETLPALETALDATLGDSRPPRLVFVELTAIPSVRRATMVWMRFDDTDDLFADLALRVRAAVANLVEYEESRPPKPHATLVRARRPRRCPRLPDAAELLQCSAHDSVSDPIATLYASRLTPRGPEYERLASWSLRGEAR